MPMQTSLNLNGKKAMTRTVHLDGRSDWTPERYVQEGKFIKDLRESDDLRMGTREAAEKAGLSTGTYNAIENGLCYNRDSIQCAKAALLLALSGRLRGVACRTADALENMVRESA